MVNKQNDTDDIEILNNTLVSIFTEILTKIAEGHKEINKRGNNKLSREILNLMKNTEN